MLEDSLVQRNFLAAITIRLIHEHIYWDCTGINVHATEVLSVGAWGLTNVPNSALEMHWT